MKMTKRQKTLELDLSCNVHFKFKSANKTPRTIPKNYEEVH